jgi:hypothetical protein
MTLITDGSSSHVHNTKRNMKAFGSSANTPPAALWFEKQFPPFMDFDQDSMCFLLLLCFKVLSDTFCASPYLRCSFPFLHVYKRRFRWPPLLSPLQETWGSEACRSSPQCSGYGFFHHEHLLKHSSTTHP